MIAAEQARACCIMALCGAVCSMVYDAAMLIGFLCGGTGLRGALNMAMGAFTAVSITAAGLYLRIDPFRLYVFAAVCFGWVLWRATLSALGRNLLRAGLDRQKPNKKRESA